MRSSTISTEKSISVDKYTESLKSLPEEEVSISRGAIARAKDGYPIKTSQKGEIAYRIYINVAPPKAVAVFSELLKARPLFTFAKMGDYDTITRCRDTIVVYAKDYASVTEIGKRLSDYQKNNADAFTNEIPVMTGPLDSLRGVGFAEDLPMEATEEAHKYWLEKGQPWQNKHEWITGGSKYVSLSHSQWRSLFILTALHNAKNKGIDAVRTELAKIAQEANLGPQKMFRRPTISKGLIVMLENELFPGN